MIERLIAIALRFRAVVVAATLALIAGGTWALLSINVDAFPDLTPNQVQVLTVAPGLSPNEVENLVSYPMETAMMGLPRTQGVRSISKAGISVVTVSYDDDVDMYFARAQVQQRMQDAVGSLPDGLRPSLGPPATPMGEVFQYLVESDTLSLMELKNIQEYTIKPLLRTVPGVADVNSWGRHGPAVPRQRRSEQARGLRSDAARSGKRRSGTTTATSVRATSRAAASASPSAASAAWPTTPTSPMSSSRRGEAAPRFVCTTSPTWRPARCRAKAPCRATAAAKRSRA